MRYVLLFMLLGFLSCQLGTTQENTSDTIGTKSYIWYDTERVDPYYGGHRLLNVQVWYPVDATVLTQTYPAAPYYYKIDTVYQSLVNWTEEDYQFVSNIPTTALVNAPISKRQTKFPVLIFSPSLGGNMSQYTYYAEYLAKAGFVVVGVNHLYESEYVIDDAMQVFPVNVRFHDSLKVLDIPSQITAEKYREVKGARQKVLGEDVVFCLDKVAELNQAEFKGQLDLEQLGAWGHSIGGAAAVYASMLDERFDAVLNLDGTPPSVALESGLKVPFMFIEDLTDYEQHEGYKKMHQRRSAFCEKNSADAYRILMADISHNSFLDINYHTAQSAEDKEKAQAVLLKTAGYMQQFFARYLTNKKMLLSATKTDSLEIITFIKK